MMRRGLLVFLAAVLALGGVACGSSQKVGNEGLLNFQEQKNAHRLGEATAAPTAGNQGALGLGAKTAPPAPRQTPPPAPKKQYFNVQLVANSPFFKPGNAIAIRRGVTLRVTNADGTPERKNGRSFTDKAGSFSSPVLKPGQTWEWTFNQAGSFEIVDQGLTFATARLDVS